ncbi:hypothetical protein RQP46_007468 [Phenoliferia psychrophenolica]
MDNRFDPRHHSSGGGARSFAHMEPPSRESEDFPSHDEDGRQYPSHQRPQYQGDDRRPYAPPPLFQSDSQPYFNRPQDSWYSQQPPPLPHHPHYSQQQIPSLPPLREQRRDVDDRVGRVDSPREPSPPAAGHFSGAASASSLDEHRQLQEHAYQPSGSRGPSRRTSEGEPATPEAQDADANAEGATDVAVDAEPPQEVGEDGKKSRKRRRLKGEPPRDAHLRKYNALATHILIHTKERPFLCITCDKTFAVMSNLRRHCRVRKHAIPPPAVRHSHLPPPDPNEQMENNRAENQRTASWLGSQGPEQS